MSKPTHVLGVIAAATLAMGPLSVHADPYLGSDAVLFQPSQTASFDRKMPARMKPATKPVAVDAGDKGAYLGPDAALYQTGKVQGVGATSTTDRESQAPAVKGE